MKKVPFATSSPLSIGIELELQIVNANHFGLEARAKDLIRFLCNDAHEKQIKPEITQSMIECNSSIHLHPDTLMEEMTSIQQCLIHAGEEMRILFAGGGTHPFQKWTALKIYPSARFKQLAQHYRYLSKRATVFGEHIHIGCKNADDALYLTHALIRYLPHLIALSASSPYYQGIDTGYQSARSNIFNMYPSSGVMPYLINWQEFSNYFYKMRSLGIIKTMKDLYWDVRPKPEFGTVEIRVCDTPLTIRRAVQLAAYAQALSAYLLEERPVEISQDLYLLYAHNRFQAIRYGFDGEIIDANNFHRASIQFDILDTLEKIAPYIKKLHLESYTQPIEEDTKLKINDAVLLRKMHKQHISLSELVGYQCKMWMQYE